MGGPTRKHGKKKAVEINGGRKFYIQDPEKNWTMSNRYKNWVHKLTRKSGRTRNKKQEDLCVGKDNICDGDLGIPRKHMPQFVSKDDVKKYKNFILTIVLLIKKKIFI